MKKCGIKSKRNIAVLTAVVLTAALLLTGCVCPLFSLFEKYTGLKIKAGENIDESAVIDELIYPGSISLVQVNGNIEKVLNLVKTYGISFSEEEIQTLEELPESLTEQEIGTIVYSTPDSRDTVLSYYDRLNENGWQIESFRNPGGGIQNSDIIIAIKENRRQALMVTGSDNRAFIIFIDFDWSVLSGDE